MFSVLTWKLNSTNFISQYYIEIPILNIILMFRFSSMRLGVCLSLCGQDRLISSSFRLARIWAPIRLLRNLWDIFNFYLIFYWHFIVVSVFLSVYTVFALQRQTNVGRINNEQLLLQKMLIITTVRGDLESSCCHCKACAGLASIFGSKIPNFN